MKSPDFRQPWIGKPIVDTLFILLPPFLSLLVIALFPQSFSNDKAVTDGWWILLVLLIDVAHVYSTLYRTYLDPSTFPAKRSLLTIIPVAAFILGVLVYSMSPVLFWRLLAYTAVFHFVRQQYGFMRLYSRTQQASRVERIIDKVAIYYATIYPIAYWHLSGPANFNWFIKDDFFYVNGAAYIPFLRSLYFLVIAAYVIREGRTIAITRQLNIPKLLVVAGTFLSWYFGIVYFNGDLSFTLLNVVSHGIPYMALVWIVAGKTNAAKKEKNRFMKLVFGGTGILLFLALVFVLAFIEEGLWDKLVWGEHGSVFGDHRPLISGQMLSIIVPLLALPQITHYVIDGFIWKAGKPGT